MLSLEGRQLGNYDIVRRIRVGGMGAVYEGRQRTAFDRRVAIKVILGDYAVDREMRRRFAREARTIARLHHPHILPLIEFGDERGLLYLVMPFIEDGTLTGYLQRELPALDDVASIYQQLLDAVEYAHEQGLIHRDIKSSNVLLEERRNGPPYVYLADFGLVRTAQQSDNEPVGVPIPLDQVPGTPHYMAPEQTVGIVTPLTDIYALGVLLYQLLTGELPYDDPDEIEVIQMHLHAPIPSPCERDPSLPAALDEVVHTAMAKQPEDRYQRIADLRRAFVAALSNSPELRDIPDDDLPPEENDFIITEHPQRPVPQSSAPLALELEPQPQPIRLTQAQPVRPKVRVQQGAAQTPLRGQQRVTGSIADRKPVTDSVPFYTHDRRRHLTRPMLAAMLVPVVLLLLLILPRFFGVSPFPAGFPVFGPPPVAVVSLTAQTKTLQENYILTASPAIKTPDLSTRFIPDRVVQSAATGNETTQATGTRAIAGVQASGTLRFENSSHVPVTVAAGTTFSTASGIAVQTIQTAEVPAAQNGQNGTLAIPAVAVNAGSAGNIPAHAIATSCCDGLSVSNPKPFSGGVDARTVHVVLQADLNRVSSQLVPGLQRQTLKLLQKQLQTDEVMANQPAYSMTVTSDSQPGTMANQVTVQVVVVGTATVYNSEQARHVAAQLLNAEAEQTFGAAYQPHGVPTTLTPRIVQQGQNGILYLSVEAKGIWAYSLSAQQLAQWASEIKGATPAVAISFLNSQKGVAGVQIQLPFGTDHLPSTSDQIKIVVVGS
jgi:serine/threonine protein kinase